MTEGQDNRGGVSVYEHDELTEIEALSDVATAWDQLDDDIADRRRRVKDMVRAGLSHSVISRVLHVSVSTVKRDVSWLKQVGVYWVQQFVNEQEIGSAAEFYDEIEQMSMELARKAAKSHVKSEKKGTVQKPGDPIKQSDGSYLPGEPTTEYREETTTIEVDHKAVQGHLKNAIVARTQKLSLLRFAGLIKTAKIKDENEGIGDVSKLSTEQLAQASARTALQLRTIEVKIAQITGSNPLKGPDKESWED